MASPELLAVLEVQENKGRRIVCSPCPFRGWAIEAWREDGVIHWRENLGERGRGPVRTDAVPDVHPFGWIATAS